MKGKRSALVCMIIVMGVIQMGLCDFSYDGDKGPAHWSDQYDQCSGKYQSPINIDEHEVIQRAFQPIEKKRFNERPVKGYLKNNGHTVEVKLEFKEDQPTISGGPLPSADTYVFQQLHFHWGENNTMGSEDRINDKSFPAELHMVFANKKYTSVPEAAKHHDGVAVLAFFYKISKNDNPNYKELTEFLQFIVKPDMRVDFIQRPMLDELITDYWENFYTYKGSLTTPPCSEDVTWIDFDKAIDISTKQMERFRQLLTHEGTLLTHNFRPLQPLNNRTIFESMPMGNPGDDPWSAIPFVDELEDDGAASLMPATWVTLLSGVVLLRMIVTSIGQ